MGLGNFFKNLFGSAKETVHQEAEKAEASIENIKESASELADKAKHFI